LFPFPIIERALKNVWVYRVEEEDGGKERYKVLCNQITEKIDQ